MRQTKRYPSKIAVRYVRRSPVSSGRRAGNEVKKKRCCLLYHLNHYSLRSNAHCNCFGDSFATRVTNISRCTFEQYSETGNKNHYSACLLRCLEPGNLVHFIITTAHWMYSQNAPCDFSLNTFHSPHPKPLSTMERGLAILRMSCSFRNVEV